MLNRVLSDLQNIDATVPDALLALATRVLTFCTQLGLVLYLVPYIALALPPLLFMYSIIYSRLRVAARDARRVSAKMHSPVFAHFADALAGRATIAAYGAEERFCAANAAHVANMSRAIIAVEAVLKWGQTLSVQSGCVFYFLAAVSCVLLQTYGQLSTSQLGLVLLYASNLQRASMDLMMQIAQVETECVAVERVVEYCRLESEFDDVYNRPGSAAVGSVVDSDVVGSTSLPTLSMGTDEDLYARALIGGGEPLRGAIEVRGVVLRYRPNKPPSLNQLSLSLPAGAKVCIVGRSGCGKSTLLKAIARLYPLDAGSIRLDGYDLANLPLAEVREHVRYVSSEPLFLKGSLLTNMCAFASHERMTRVTDVGICGNASTLAEAEAWAALDSFGMRSRVEGLPLQLHSEAAECDFSAGEWQLLSLARALVAGRGPRGAAPAHVR